MAELTSGAVTTLLGIIRDETLLLSSVRGDVQFIKQEMESMKSFLAHLGRTAPPGGEHDEQVRAWMNQVRLLAQDCNNCITTYRYYGDPDIHRARDGLRRYIWWLPWFVRKVAAQHDAAIRLRELKDQARDIGERRQRYGVEVPAKALMGLSISAAGSGSPPFTVPVPFDDVDDEAEQAESSSEEADHGARRAVLEARSLDDYFRGKLDDWMQDAKKAHPGGRHNQIQGNVLLNRAATLLHPLRRTTRAPESGRHISRRSIRSGGAGAGQLQIPTPGEF